MNKRVADAMERLRVAGVRVPASRLSRAAFSKRRVATADLVGSGALARFTPSSPGGTASRVSPAPTVKPPALPYTRTKR